MKLPRPGPQSGCHSIYSETRVFSPPRSDRTIDGKPYNCTAFRNDCNTVVALFFTSMQINWNSGVTVNSTVDDDSPPYKFVVPIYMLQTVWPPNSIFTAMQNSMCSQLYPQGSTLAKLFLILCLYMCKLHDSRYPARVFCQAFGNVTTN